MDIVGMHYDHNILSQRYELSLGISFPPHVALVPPADVSAVGMG